jgi:two-component system, cell cycle sensor histidine kinase and response regulator CckA
MYNKVIKVLLIEDDEDDYVMTRELLSEIEGNRFDLTWVATYQEALAVIESNSHDICLIDYRLGEQNGIELLYASRANGHTIPAILLTGQGDSHLDHKAMKAGASDYLVKDHLNKAQLERSIRYTIERNMVLNALRESESRYRRIVETTSEGIWTLDAEGRTSYVNQRMTEILGYSAEEMLGRHYFDFMGGDARTQAAEQLAHRRRGIAEQYELQLKHRDGRDLWAQISANPMFGENGEFLGSLGMLTDITERRRLEKERKRLAMIVESSDDAILSKTLDGLITSWNAGAERMYGYTAAEAVGRHISIIVPADRHAELAGIMGQVKQGERVKHLETIRVNKDGRRVDVSISISPVKDESGCAVGASTIARDITERKRMEESLFREKEYISHIISAAPVIVVGITPEGATKFVNQAVREVTGYEPEELVDKNWWRVLYPENEYRQVEQLFKDFERGAVVNYEMTLTTKHGEKRSVSWNSVNVVNEPGEISEVIGIGVDVTERKRSEEMVREADRRAVEEYARLLDRLACLALSFGTARDMLSVYRGLRDFSLSLTPSFALAICSYDEAQQMREGVYFYLNGVELPPPSAGQMPVRSGPVGRAIKSGAAIICNDFLKDLSETKPVHLGAEVDAEMPRSALIAPMTIMGRTIGTVEVQSHEPAAYTHEHATAIQMAANLTANAIENVRLLDLEREKEEQLRMSQKMEAVGQLAGGVAHDFNNLLTAIMGYSDLTLRRLGEGDPLRGNIQEIKKAGERAATLTHQLLAFSRRQVLKPKVFNLNLVITDMEKMLNRLIREDIDIRLKLAPDVGQIKADLGQLEQVVVNLVVNARDAMPGGGRLTIETSNVHLDEEYASEHIAVTPGPHVMLVVSDTGVGMDEKTRRRIFEPFFTTKEAGKGTGLGLSTVYGIVKQSGGNVWVYSEVGQGTAFKIYLPRVDDTAEQIKKTSRREEIRQGTGTILLVEDDESVRSIALRTLEMYGYGILEARDGEEALAIASRREEKIDLLLTDVVMPGMSGRQLVERLQALRPDINVLYMSGYTEDAIRYHGVLGERTAFIEKPFAPDKLGQKVREVLDKYRRARGVE